MKPTIAITMGDPTGVGPEVILKALTDRNIRQLCTPVVLGDEAVLEFVSAKCKLQSANCKVINLSNLNPPKLKPGRPDKICAKAMMTYIEEAVCMAMAGDVDAIVTAPISKEAINRAGYKFHGHTEFLAHLTKTKDYAMMLAGSSLKVILLTIHESIKNVPGLLTTEKVFKTIKITDNTFKRYFGLKKPRIAVAALNPHAGEGGLFGGEEKRIILPAIKKARQMGINASDPLPPDTLFYRAVKNKEFDCVICMYHDQGLIPLKLLHFENGVNVTLGLPIIRTSVDHGTAYDIAWKGIANPASMKAAIKMAVEMVGKKRRRNF
ncbi:MAG: 4-hydroxythreonine-4-phosphate dehydrogenase PdxA [Deltaproteobacteria bacterium RIFCSPLOWO2_12_FULL_43_16]|nr:MAG: 4-hydroxythreonine-4-phosphate dehydrogenase PdxA [Deltaproteobacteria bacterium GWA2_43_19]OGQ12625.1 MAG: 4-hydroxythreonine-4-phosphate dehydrogenase PdxA [Deltaproteobacteria bacterium RIFCSPHIGHO2_02_FULL_43_33]OGQ56862.1 MAG: 4-hydroxythreonine-4-phosphate dehydrogenase PdxA [Deltaproteobacteria bacterium RIFCSPLOWO2_12_FULL_43_16]HBR17920.1 4-hydroxythreonine-4-phosphate dehydrogenase PdxA [Deltaproteobacteria bacterium]